MLVKILTIVITILTGVDGFGSGAPFGLCLTMYPHHRGTHHQTTPSPFKIHVSKATYSPSEELTAVIKADDDMTFKGVEMRVHRVSGNTEEILGEFTEYPKDKLQTQNCYFGKNNLITHSNNKTVTNLTIKWKAPPDNVGNILFTATVVHNFTTFWHDIETVIQPNHSVAVTPAQFQLPNYTSIFTQISWETCGKSKGCFFHPPSCSGPDCTIGVSYKMNPDSTYSFEMVGPSTHGEGWIGVGFSKDKKMGEDLAFLCTTGPDNVEVQYTYNPDVWNVRQYTQNFTNVETKKEDGRLFCRFTQSSLPRFDDNGAVNFNLTEKWYLFLAYGGTLPHMSEAEKHADYPAISYTKISLGSLAVVTTDTVSVSIKHLPSVFSLFFVMFISLSVY
ncbi:hypothetical protein LOTGIDRAFT_233861 [Lottia gigantea]|uniref:Reelin domain-containing protein n=1 Tax=Lottia gigantea TaxID=225164 RepID=V4A5Y2_LOTGI|nr:hypothetical protein LOTGIDRAFT_233861 [Lottia gigantea]ESO90385.1 hypothetical protein LOTGIDRAFT_233861 [Lottia gigantea]